MGGRFVGRRLGFCCACRRVTRSREHCSTAPPSGARDPYVLVSHGGRLHRGEPASAAGPFPQYL